MTPRCNVYDPLQPTTEPRWYVVRSMHGAIREAHQLPAGTALKHAFAAAIQRWIDAGWMVGEFSSRAGVFFCDRGAERRAVSIEPNDPARPHAERQGWHHPPCPGRED
jgi:hypothetical protein